MAKSDTALEFRGTERYYLDPELEAIVNMALAMEKPLLLTGEAGTGKTQLAMEVARALKLDSEVLRAKSTIKGEEACYVQDTVLRLNDARFGSGETGRGVDNFFDYVIWGPIGRAFRADTKVMLLLDEIDKTESDVQDNLLDILEDCEFTIREVNKTIKASIRPAIFLTSNAKRELSDPFLRRCFCHHIAFPTPEQMQEILKLHFPRTSPKLMETAIAIFYELRERGFEKPPATSELINWIGALERSGRTPDAKEPPLIGILLKRAGDIATYRDSGKGRRYL
ncbi:MAG: MoxR family ATPase [Candidatus Hydrogenedentes bacterium]|nr:MoxR family ATPase [Candidatus Hydrogenedentota bacterium]